MRRFHSLAGLIGAVLVVLMASTGFILSLQPIADAASTLTSSAGTSVAMVADVVAEQMPGVERLVRSASGQVVAYGFEDGTRTAVVIDPATGAATGAYEPSAFFSFVTELHRSFLLGTFGRGAAGIAALAMLGLSISGLLLLVSKMGGWRKLLAGARGTKTQRLHTDLARIAVVALLMTAASGAYMSAVNFELVPESAAAVFSLPPSSQGDSVAGIGTLAALQDIALTDLRELSFPAAGDASDVFTVTTNAGQGYVDQGTGAMLSFTVNDVWQQVYEWFYLLHTGQGVPLIALVVGLGALAVPVLALTGTAIWWQRQRSTPHIENNAGWREADTVILVGSEAGSTWGFAATLHGALQGQGQKVHVAAMNSLRRDYPKAERLLVLAATHGEGTAPASATQFFARLGAFSATPDFAVLGFGDQSFPRFCAYAVEVDAVLAAKGLKRLLPIDGIDRQSAGDFAAWGQKLGAQLGMPLTLTHVPVLPPRRRLVLVERTLYGMEVQAPMVVLRFAVPKTGRWFTRHLPRFEVGDLVGITPPGSQVPRYYSLASGSRDGVLEICVSKQVGGLCSEYLHGLVPGDAIELFVRANPDFRHNGGKRPLILVGAGAGLAPLAGFIRHNWRHKPIHLFFGARDPNSDFLYRDEMLAALEDGRLTALNTNFSRVLGGGYVQDRLAAEAEAIRMLVRQGAQIMVCGGRDMAKGVRDALDQCLAPLGLSADALKQKGLYLEDAY